jgi:ABC-type phosphate/phosphonate transport system substrate-binding protein
MRRLTKLPLFVFGLGLLGAALYAAAGGGDKAAPTRVAFNPSNPPAQAPLATTAAPGVNDTGTYVFGTPPGGGYEEELAKYQPIAEHLSRVTGKRFVYRYAADWLSYSKNMASGAYDVVFDGPAFNGWRIDRMSHTPLVKLPDDVVFVVVTRADGRIGQLKQLAGHRVCAIAPPDVGALALLSRFDNPARQPVIAEARSWQEAHKGLIEGRCAASVMSQKNLEAIGLGAMKVIYQHRPLPNYAFSAGPRLTPEMKDKVRDALLSASGKIATAKLRASYGGGDFIAATPAEYAGLAKLLKDSLYYH